jgi:hypothetical protein
MSMILKNPEDQADRKKGTISNQPPLTHVTPIMLLGSWGQQLLEDVTSLWTDFETHAYCYWQGYADGLAAKDFLATKAHTITLSKVQGTH